MYHLETSFMNNNFILGSSVVQDYTVPARTKEGQTVRFEKIRSLEDNRKFSRRDVLSHCVHYKHMIFVYDSGLWSRRLPSF